MKRAFWPLALVVVMVLVVPDAMAAFGAPSNGTSGNDALGMATYMYCGAKQVLQGYVGLLLGLILVTLGLWALIRGKGLMTGLTLMIFGSIITALPSIIESSLEGLSSLMQTAEIGTSGFSSLTCGANMPAPVDNSDIDPFDPSKLIINKMSTQQLKQEEYQALPFYAPGDL